MCGAVKRCVLLLFLVSNTQVISEDFHVTDYARRHFSDAMIGKCENLDQ